MMPGVGGIDLREWNYTVFQYLVPDGATHTLTPGAQRWRVSKISVYADATHAVSLLGGRVGCAAGGCLILEPNLALQTNIEINGQGAKLIVEYWWHTAPGGIEPPIAVTP